MGDANEDDHVGNAIRQVIEDLTPRTRLAGSERDHPVEHVAPETKVAKKRREEQEQRVSA
jgi:hypothetical protein